MDVNDILKKYEAKLEGQLGGSKGSGSDDFSTISNSKKETFTKTLQPISYPPY